MFDNLSNDEKLRRFNHALETFVARLAEDRYILAAVLVGSLIEETVWHKDGVGLWIIETDGVSRRLRSDGKDERIFRNFVEEGVNIHAEVIPRSRFKQMVEGTSRTAFSCNFFAKRELVYCADPSIESWFADANEVATKDQKMELLATTTWTIHAARHARRQLEFKKDLDLAMQELLWAAHSIAYLEIIRHGEVQEFDVIYKAIELQPDLFQTIYIDLISKSRTRKRLASTLKRIDEYLDEHSQESLSPLVRYLKKQQRVVPLSEISDHFAYSQLYPWHIESACDWLEEKGELEKVATPFQITKKSTVQVEEPAYFLDS